MKIEVTGGGGILILGSVLIAAAVGAGTAFVARRAQRRRSSTTAKPADDEVIVCSRCVHEFLIKFVRLWIHLGERFCFQASHLQESRCWGNRGHHLGR